MKNSCLQFWCYICVTLWNVSKQENVLRQAVKKWSSTFYVSWQFTPNYQFGSLPQTTNLVLCVCGGWAGGGGKLPNALVVYLKLPIWYFTPNYQFGL